MPKKRRQAKIPTPAWERPRGALGQRVLGRTPQFYGTIGVVALVVVALGIIGFAYWSDYRAGQQRPGSTAVQVEDTKYTLRYYAERLKMFVQQVGGPGNQLADPQVAIPAVAEQLVQEAIALRFASEKEVAASEEEIKSALASRLGLTTDDPNFEVRFQEELSRSRLTEEEYRGMTEAFVLLDKIRAKLQSELPASAESVHYRQILVSDEAAAEEIRDQVRGGADFAQLAAERSLDTGTKDQGGDGGWVPRGVLDPALEEFTFGMQQGDVTTYPIPSGGVYVLQMLEKADSREIDAQQKPALAQRALQKWIQEKRGQVEVRDFVSGDQDKARWAIDHAYSVT